MKINEKLYQQVVRKCSDIGDLIAFGPDHGGCDTERMVLASPGGEFEVHRVVAWGCLWSIHCLVGCFGPWVHSPQSSPIITQGDNAKVDSTRESNWMREFNSIATPCPLFKYRQCYWFLLLFTGRVYKYNHTSAVLLRYSKLVYKVMESYFIGYGSNIHWWRRIGKKN